MKKPRPTPTLEQFKQLAADVAPAARAVLMARVHAQMERERVNRYALPLLTSYQFKVAERFARSAQPAGEVITDLDKLYLIEDDRLPSFFADLDAAHRAHGFTGPDGHCPALRAENLVMDVENALINICAPVLGVESHELYGENRVKYIELLIGAALKADAEAAA